MTPIGTILVLVVTILFVSFARLASILPCLYSYRSEKHQNKIIDESKTSIMILLGSGGHTGEMIRILSGINISNFKRTWVVSSGDSTSITKAESYEKDISSSIKPTYIMVHRARRVGESMSSSIFNTLKSFVLTASEIIRLPILPKILILNGPGTSVPLAYILFMLKFFFICDTKIIYIESLARVNSLSLSGLLCLPISDRFIVQWEPLHEKYQRSEYYGILV